MKLRVLRSCNFHYLAEVTVSYATSKALEKKNFLLLTGHPTETDKSLKTQRLVPKSTSRDEELAGERI